MSRAEDVGRRKKNDELMRARSERTTLGIKNAEPLARLRIFNVTVGSPWRKISYSEEAEDWRRLRRGACGLRLHHLHHRERRLREDHLHHRPRRRGSFA